MPVWGISRVEIKGFVVKRHQLLPPYRPTGLRRTGWETTFRGAHRDILVRLTELPHCTANRLLPLGVVEGEAIL
jgi:hypothetical protein